MAPAQACAPKGPANTRPPDSHYRNQAADPDGLERCARCQKLAYHHTNGGGTRTTRHAGCGPLQRRYETANYGTITSVFTKGPPRDDATTDYDGERWTLKPCTCPCHSRPTASAWVRQHEWVRVVDYDAQE